METTVGRLRQARPARRYQRNAPSEWTAQSSTLDRMGLTVKGAATRQRIIEGAAMHLRADAPGDVTLDEIRSITGTSKSQIFHYFPSGKDELLLAVAQHEADRVLSDQQPHLGTLDSWAAWERWRD